MTENNNKVRFLQYLNTAILTAILAFLSINYATLNSLRKDNIETQKQLIQYKTIQDYNVADIKALQAEVAAIKTYQTEVVKSWVEQNFLRKAQQK